MKSALLYLSVLLSLVLVSCEDEDTSTKDLLIGKWELVSFEMDGEREVHEHSTCGKDYFEFTKDQKFAEYYYDDENNCSLDAEIEGSYVKVNETTLTLSSLGGSKISATVKSLTKEELILLIEGETIVHKRI